MQRIIDEGTSVCLAHEFEGKNDWKVFVFDMGAGGFSTAILEIGEGVFEVKETSGSIHPCSEAFDLRLMNCLADEFEESHRN